MCPSGIGGGSWYRFEGVGGDALPLTHPGPQHCGTNYPLVVGVPAATSQLWSQLLGTSCTSIFLSHKIINYYTKHFCQPV